MSAYSGPIARCGTTSGHARHLRLDEKPCDACATAKREYDVRYRSAPDRTRKSRLAAKAQARASVEMRHLYPEVWKVLYAKHVKAVTAEANRAEVTR